MKIKLKCRACDKTEVFEDTETALESDWFEISPLGGMGDGVSVHRAYCCEYPFES